MPQQVPPQLLIHSCNQLQATSYSQTFELTFTQKGHIGYEFYGKTLKFYKKDKDKRRQTCRNKCRLTTNDCRQILRKNKFQELVHLEKLLQVILNC